MQDLVGTDRLMLHVVDLDLDLIHAVHHLLLHSRLLHLVFQCMEGFQQLLAINAKLLSKSAIVFVCKAPVCFKLSNPGQQLCLLLLYLLLECKNLLLKSHQMLLNLRIITSSGNIVLVGLRGLHKDTRSSWGELPIPSRNNIRLNQAYLWFLSH